MARPMALSLNQLPIVRHATFGVPWTVAVPIGLVMFLLFDGVPAILARDARDAVDLLQQGALGHLVLCVGAALAVSFASRRGTLTVDRDGIAVDSGHDRQFYAWCNLAGTRAAGRGEVELVLRGVDLDAAASTTIPRAYGIAAREWETLVADGVGRFGRTDPHGRATVAGSGALSARWTWIAGARVLAGILLAIALSSFAGDYARNRAMVDLAASGVRTTGTVIGSDGDACTRRGCERWLAYRFTTREPKTVAIGHDRLTLPGYVAPAPGVLATGQVPVIYDPANPARSLIATADTVAAHGGGALRFTGALAAVLALVLAALLAVPAIATLATPFDAARGRRLVG